MGNILHNYDQCVNEDHQQIPIIVRWYHRVKEYEYGGAQDAVSESSGGVGLQNGDKSVTFPEELGSVRTQPTGFNSKENIQVQGWGYAGSRVQKLAP